MTINIISIILFALAGISLVVAIYSFIRFNVPQLIGELTGRTAKKTITQMREKNAKTGNKSHRPSVVEKKRGTLTDKIDEKKIKKAINQSYTTELLDVETDMLSNKSDDENNREVLSNATELLNNNATELLNDNTSVLNEEETSVLSPSMLKSAPIQVNDGFKMIQNIIFIHTNEII